MTVLEDASVKRVTVYSLADPGANVFLLSGTGAAVRLRLLGAAAQRRGQHLADRLDEPAHLVGDQVGVALRRGEDAQA